MNFEDIGRVWRDENTGDLRRTRTEILSTALGQAIRYNAGRRTALRRTGYGIGSPLILLFGVMAARAPNLAASAGAILLAILAAVVLFRFVGISRDARDPTLPVRLAIEREVSRLRALEELEQEVKWGRALLAIGYLLYTFGVAFEVTDLRARIAGMAAFILWFAIIDRLGVRVARRRRHHIQELREDLQSWLRGLDEYGLEEPADRLA